jgi:TonB family protein
MRIAACFVVLAAGCAKQASKESATAAPPDRERVSMDEPPSQPTQPAPMAPTGGAPNEQGQGTAAPVVGAKPEEKAAKEAARSQGLLGPSDQDSFRPLEDPVAGSGKEKSTTRSGTVAQNAAGPGEKGDGAATGIALGAPVLATKADASLVVTALGKRRPELDKCYATARGTRVGLTGSLTVAFTIQPDGRLASVTVASSTVKDAALETCIVGVVGATKLDKPLGTAPIKATLPITFTPPPAQ